MTMIMLLALTLCGSIPATAFAGSPALAAGEPGDGLRFDGTREIVCSQPGMLGGYKVPADTNEVANDCIEAGTAQVVRAVWWGGYTEWEPGDPHITTFHVRFYEELDCTPFNLIAEYLAAEPDTFFIGNCTDSLPCFRYELDVDVPVSGPFWFSVQSAFGGEGRYPPKWGRLGDEVIMGCTNRIRAAASDDWVPLDPLRMDVSQEFLVERPTPAGGETWGAIKARYWPER